MRRSVLFTLLSNVNTIKQLTDHTLKIVSK